MEMTETRSIVLLFTCGVIWTANPMLVKQQKQWPTEVTDLVNKSVRYNTHALREEQKKVDNSFLGIFFLVFTWDFLIWKIGLTR